MAVNKKQKIKLSVEDVSRLLNMLKVGTDGTLSDCKNVKLLSESLVKSLPPQPVASNEFKELHEKGKKGELSDEETITLRNMKIAFELDFKKFYAKEVDITFSKSEYNYIKKLFNTFNKFKTGIKFVDNYINLSKKFEK